MKKLALALALVLWSGGAWAQNPQCPTRPAGDNSNACASTAFVQTAITGLGANPTAQVGLTAVNGVASTFIRSDGAPALSQAIAPTWTGVHTHNNNVVVANGIPLQFKDSGGTARNTMFMFSDDVVYMDGVSGIGFNMRNSLAINPQASKPGFTITQTWAGVTSNASYNLIYVTSDTANSGTDFNAALNVYLVGGTGMVGNRAAVQGLLNIGGTPTSDGNYIAVHGVGSASAPSAPFTTGSQVFGGAFWTNIQSGGTGYYLISGVEINFGINTGGSATHKTGLQIIQHTLDAVDAADTNAMLLISSQAPAVKMEDGILFTRLAGQAPLKTTGTVLRTSGADTVADFIDGFSYTVTGYAWKMANSLITGAGETLVAGYLRVGSVSAPANTTAGDITGVRLNLGNVTQVQAATISGDGSLTGYLRVGSNTAPTNTTAGDFTATRLSLGDTALTTAIIRASSSLTGGTTARGIWLDATVSSSVTTEAMGFSSTLATAAASFTAANIRHFKAAQGTIGATSTVTNQVGFYVANSLTGATNNYGFYSDIASGSNRFNFYANGTAANLFNGATTFGSGTNATSKSTGAVIVTTGGIGIGGDIWANSYYIDHATAPQFTLLVASAGIGSVSTAGTSFNYNTFGTVPHVFIYNALGGGGGERMRLTAGLNVGSAGTDPGLGNISAEGTVKTGTTTVGSLGTCNAGAKGVRWFVSDANATTFASTVAAGGANNVPVVCNGTNWIIGYANDNELNKKMAA